MGTNSTLQWSLLLNVLFGSIAGRAFTEFYTSLNQEHVNDECHPEKANSLRYYICRYIAFIAAFSFYIYDWVVLQILYSHNPYSLHSTLSFVRFANDIVMAYFLFGIVWYSAMPRIFDKPILLLQRISLWHVMAATWHMLAAFEYSKKIDFLVIGWHCIAVQAIYWIPFIAQRRIACRKKHAAGEAKRLNAQLLIVLSLSVLAISFARTYVVVTTMPEK